MSPEWVTAASAGLTLVVIAVTAFAAIRQMGHMRMGNQVALFTAYNTEWNSPQFSKAFAFVLSLIHIYLVKTGYDPVYGARPLKRAIQKEIETPLGRKILAGEIRDGQHVKVDYDEKRGELTFNAQPVPS